jgi:hypothetical protein
MDDDEEERVKKSGILAVAERYRASWNFMSRCRRQATTKNESLGQAHVAVREKKLFQRKQQEQ